MSLRHPLVREALLSATAAALVAAALAWLGPPGTDFAAHAYQRTLFLDPSTGERVGGSER